MHTDFSTVFYLFGLQGSGKSTLAQFIADTYNARHFEAGQLLRDQSETLQASLQGGNMAPDETTNGLYDTHVCQTSGNVVVDGYPRNKTQFEYLSTKLNPNWRVVVVILDINQEVAINRLLNRGREDDTQEAIQKRFTTYFRLTQPIIDKMITELNCCYIHLDASQDTDTIQLELATFLDEYGISQD
jgi:adenylate kinase